MMRSVPNFELLRRHEKYDNPGSAKCLSTIAQIPKFFKRVPTPRPRFAFPRSRDPGFPGSRVPAFPRSRVPAFPRSRVSAFPRSRVPAFPRSRGPAFPISRVPAFPRSRVPGSLGINWGGISARNLGKVDFPEMCWPGGQIIPTPCGSILHPARGIFLSFS